MLDLTQHLPQDDQWVDDYAARLGWEALCRYYERVFLRLLAMLTGEELHVALECRPDNYDLFLKCACTAIRELNVMTVPGAWHVEQRATIIRRS